MILQKTSDKAFGYDPHSAAVLQTDDNAFLQYKAERNRMMEVENCKKMINDLAIRINELEQIIREKNG